MSSAPITIVLVDDDAPTLAAMMHLLEMEDYAVFGAKNGREALAVIADVCPAAVVSDVRMPIMGGEELVAALTASHGPPVILMTAHALVDNESAVRMGAVAVIHKPIDIDELLALIATVVGTPTNPAASPAATTQSVIE